MSYKTVLFNSSLANLMYDFINYKRMQGYDYSHPEDRLCMFDRFLHKISYSKNIITQEVVYQYNQEIFHLKPATRAGLFSTVRNFSKYLNMFKPDSYVLPAGSMKFSIRKRYYLYSRKEICILIEAARSQKYRDAAISHC